MFVSESRIFVSTTLRIAFACACLALAACDDRPVGPSTVVVPGPGLLPSRELTATVDGVPIRLTVTTAGFLSGRVLISGTDGRRTFLLDAANVRSFGAVSLAPVNANNALAQFTDTVAGSFSSRNVGGSGTVTFTTLLPSRVAGSIVATLVNDAVRGPRTVRFVAEFDVESP
jgi:hypothetical protein